MRIRLRNTIAFLLLLIAIIIYRFALLETYVGWGNSTAQFVLLPFVLASIALFSFWHYVFPRIAIVLACIASIGSGFATFGVQPEQLDAIKIYLAPFRSDPHEAQSIKFSTLITKTFERLDLNYDLERVSNPVSDIKGVNDFLRKKYSEDPGETTLLISGSSRWLSLSLSPKFSTRLVSDSLSKITSALNINVVSEVSGTGLSNAFSVATQEYLVLLLAAFNSLNDRELDKAEEYLVNAASIVDRWTSNGHRAYALWILGTIYLNKAFDQDSIEPAYLNCAIDYLSRANRFLKRDRNPELSAAVFNNLATAHFLGYMFLGQKDFRKKALKEFKVASKFISNITELIKRPAWFVARENLYSLVHPTNLKQQFARKMRKRRKAEAAAVS